MRRFQHNEALRAAVRRMPCFLCGNPETDPCHIATFGARGIDAWWSMVPMCRAHHEEQHRVGWWEFTREHKKADALLTALGWVWICAHGKRWLQNEKEKELE